MGFWGSLGGFLCVLRGLSEGFGVSERHWGGGWDVLWDSVRLLGDLKGILGGGLGVS